MKRLCRLFLLAWLATWPAAAQDAYVAPPESLVIDGVPKIPMAMAETAGHYASFRSAGISDWHPTRHEMLISTRFAETPQLHIVAMPGASDSKSLFSRTRFRTGASIRTAATTSCS